MNRMKVFYILILLNGLIVVLLNVFSLAIDNWIVIKPIREVTMNRTEFEDLPDFFESKGCKRFTGVIIMGLFKTTSLLNHGYGCNDRLEQHSGKACTYR